MFRVLLKIYVPCVPIDQLINLKITLKSILVEFTVAHLYFRS